jgi:hypothetical protein
MMNQAIIDKLLIAEGEVVGHVLADPFRQLLSDGLTELLEQAERVPDWLQPGVEEPQVPAVPVNERTADLSLVGGSINEKMVELAGLEPATSWVRSRRSSN